MARPGWELGGPVGEAVAKALQEGYTDKSQPYHGYYFKVLKGQLERWKSTTRIRRGSVPMIIGDDRPLRSSCGELQTIIGPSLVITPVNSVTKANPILSHLFASGGAGHSVDGSENPLVALSLNH